MYRAQWMPIFLEPIPHSGERFCALIGITGQDGVTRSVSTLPRSALGCLFGEDAEALADLVGLAASSLDRHLASGAAMVDWLPPYEGLYVGPSMESVDIDLQAIIEAARANMSSLSAVSVEDDETADPADQWISQIQQEVLRQRASLRPNFNRKFHFGGGTPIRIGYVGNMIALNFVSANPKSASISGQVSIATRKILQLNTVRKHGRLFKIPRVEILVRVPSGKAWEELDSGQLARLERTMADIERYADDVDVQVRAILNPHDAAKIILADANNH